MKTRLSPKRLRALRRLHAAKRGSRIWAPDPDRLPALRRLADAGRDLDYLFRSYRQAALYCGVCDRTVRRWAAQTHWPSPAHLRKLKRWLARVGYWP